MEDATATNAHGLTVDEFELTSVKADAIFIVIEGCGSGPTARAFFSHVDEAAMYALHCGIGVTDRHFHVYSMKSHQVVFDNVKVDTLI